MERVFGAGPVVPGGALSASPTVIGDATTTGPIRQLMVVVALGVEVGGLTFVSRPDARRGAL
jgi:hypothetical protein